MTEDAEHAGGSGRQASRSPFGRWSFDRVLIAGCAAFLLSGTFGIWLAAGLTDAVLPLLGAWLALTAALSIVLVAGWRLAAKVVGASEPGAYGFRTAAVLTALLVAGAASPPVLQDILRTGGAFVRLALVSTPMLAVEVGQSRMRDRLPQPPAGGGQASSSSQVSQDTGGGQSTSASGVAPTIANSQSTSGRGAAPAAGGGEADKPPADEAQRPALTGNAAASRLLACVRQSWPGRVAAAANPGDETLCGGVDAQTRTARAADWAIYLSAMLLSLILARSFFDAYRRQYIATCDAERREGAEARKPVISYGQWLSLAVYAAILAPAAYLAIGSLVLLQSPGPVPPPQTFAASLAAEGDDRDALHRELDESAGAVRDGLRIRRDVAEAAARADQLYLTLVNEARAMLPSTRFDERIAVLRQWRSDYRNRLAQIARQCREGAAGQQAPEIAAPHAQENAAAPSLTPPSPSAPPPTAPNPNGGDGAEAGGPTAPAAAFGSMSQQGGVDAPSTAVDNAVASVCVLDGKDPSPPLVRDPEVHDLVDLLYPWLGADRQSRPVVLMMGLLGFGLFGAAIRTMGSRERQLVTEMERPEAKLDAGQFGSMIVHGSGAAMAVFLAFQGGALFFSGGGEPSSPFPQLLFVFLGAVFAEEVWAWGRRALQAVLGRTQGSGDLGARRDAAKQRVDEAADAARGRVARLPEGDRDAQISRLDAALFNFTHQRDAAERALTESEAAWFQAQKAPSQETTRAWSDKFGVASDAVTALAAAAEAAINQIALIAPAP